jgi:hypothetical protein
MSTEIVKHQAAQAASLPEKMQYAKALAESGMLPSQYRKQPANLLYALEYAESLGLHPMAAITGIHVIEGKPSASSALISALVRRAGHKLRVRGNDQEAIAQIVRADDPDFTFEVRWTMARAEQAGLARKQVWKNYPAAMLKARAITEVARDACEEALSGMHYTPEELGANVDAEGVPVEAEVQQLRRVEPGQSDQWATPAATVQAATADVPAESLTPGGRDYLHEAHAAPDAATVRLIWQDAKAEGARPEYLTQIADVGKEKAAAEQQPSATAADDDIPDVETVAEGETEADIAERELRAAAVKAGLNNVDEEFEKSFGLPIAEAGAQQLREMTGLLTGSAA